MYTSAFVCSSTIPASNTASNTAEHLRKSLLNHSSKFICLATTTRLGFLLWSLSHSLLALDICSLSIKPTEGRYSFTPNSPTKSWCNISSASGVSWPQCQPFAAASDLVLLHSLFLTVFDGYFNGGPPADLLINQRVRDNVSGHTTRAPPGRVRTDNQTVPALCHNH